MSARARRPRPSITTLPILVQSELDHAPDGRFVETVADGRVLVTRGDEEGAVGLLVPLSDRWVLFGLSASALRAALSTLRPQPRPARPAGHHVRCQCALCQRGVDE